MQVLDEVATALLHTDGTGRIAKCICYPVNMNQPSVEVLSSLWKLRKSSQ